jgi:ADP-heptose:LPS heptosyltransferase
MGWGDEIMVTAQARRMQRTDPRPVAVRSKKGGARWHPIWDNNPRLARPDSFVSGGDVQWCENYPGRRPYLDYKRFDNRNPATPLVFVPSFRVEPGEIYFSAQERELAKHGRGRIIIEPNIKPGASPNKDWSWSRWRRLARELRDLPLLQLGVPGSRVLEGVQFLSTLNMRTAAAILAGAELVIAPEGGLHHAAAALGVRAVVIFGGFISPATTGYDMHRNLFTGGQACGMRIPCRHCADAMAKITPAQVAAAAREQLERKAAA